LSRLSFTASIIQASSSSYFILKNSRKYLAWKIRFLKSK
jgi:hypothetical protein